MTFLNILKNKKLLFFLFIFIVLELFLINLRGVWAPDEARYARVSFEMKEKNSFLIPYLNGEIYKEKPPLFFDLAILFSIFNDSVPHYSVKLVSLFSALAVIIISIAIAKKFGLRQIILIPLILIGTPKFFWQAQFGQIDMLLCALVLLQFFLGISIIEIEGRSVFLIVILGIVSFFAITTKGPAGVLPVYIAMTFCSFFVKKRKVMTYFGESLLISLILTTLWLYFAGLVAGFEYSNSLIFKQTLTRYFEPWHHHAPFYYYFLVVLADGFPFIFLFIPALVHTFKKDWYKERKFLYPLVLIAVYFLFFSISSGKRSVYILPVYPLIAISLSFAIEKWMISEFPKKNISVFSSFIGLIPIISIPFLLKKVNFSFSNEIVFLLFGISAFFIGVVIFLFYFVKKTEFHLQLLTIFFLLLMFSALPAIHSLDKIKVPYDLISSLKHLTKSGTKIGVFPSLLPSVNYYLESNTQVFKKQEDKLAKNFLSEGNLLLTKEKDTPKSLTNNSIVIWKGAIGDKDYLLLASQ